MTTDGKTGSFWATVPGILTGVAAVLTAITGLLVGLKDSSDDNPVGSVGGSEDTPSAVTSGRLNTVPPTTPVLRGKGDPIAGVWRGEAANPDGSHPFSMQLIVGQPCRLKQSCGTVVDGSHQCTGRITLVGVDAGIYEFEVDRFTATSGPDCSPGAGDFFKLLDDGSLRYFADYRPATGVLHRVAQ